MIAHPQRIEWAIAIKARRRGIHVATERGTKMKQTISVWALLVMGLSSGPVWSAGSCGPDDVGDSLATAENLGVVEELEQDRLYATDYSGRITVRNTLECEGDADVYRFQLGENMVMSISDRAIIDNQEHLLRHRVYNTDGREWEDPWESHFEAGTYYLSLGWPAWPEDLAARKGTAAYIG